MIRFIILFSPFVFTPLLQLTGVIDLKDWNEVWMVSAGLLPGMSFFAFKSVRNFVAGFFGMINKMNGK